MDAEGLVGLKQTGKNSNYFLTIKHRNMNNLLTTIAIILVIGWLIGWQGFGAALGGFVHILLVLAVIAIAIRLITGRRV